MPKQDGRLLLALQSPENILTAWCLAFAAVVEDKMFFQSLFGGIQSLRKVIDCSFGC